MYLQRLIFLYYLDKSGLDMIYIHSWINFFEEEELSFYNPEFDYIIIYYLSLHLVIKPVEIMQT